MTHQSIFRLLFIVILSSTICGCRPPIVGDRGSMNANLKLAGSSSRDSALGADAERLAVIYRSSDLGKTWSSFDKGIPESATLSAIQQEGEKIYVATDYHGIYFSEGGLNNWQKITSYKLENLDINCIEVAGKNVIVGTLKNGILVSDDQGHTWSQAQLQMDTPIRAFIKTEESIYAGTDSGIFRSDDMGRTWSHAFGKIQILGFTSLNNKIYAATQNGALVFSGKPTIWTPIYEGDALHDIGNDGEFIYAMTISQQLLKTKNDGLLWQNAQNGIDMPDNYYTNELKHIDKNVFSAQWLGIYHSTNNGSSWEKLSGLPDSTAFSTLEITDYGIIAGISIR